MFQKCSNCQTVSHTRKFGKKYYCRFCSDTILSSAVEEPQVFTAHHVSQALGQIANHFHERISALEEKLKIKNESELFKKPKE